MSSTPNGHVVRFEIPGFGVTKFRPEAFERLYVSLMHCPVSMTVANLREHGFDLAVMNQPHDELSKLEWIAIWGECSGKGLD
ncbi:hypothetical protein SEA_KENREY_268 [Streptomyces phage Kenrey]|nr:hypothetical protein SEA_KENREY_268 [Streptomyces phage Kenrey]